MPEFIRICHGINRFDPMVLKSKRINKLDTVIQPDPHSRQTIDGKIRVRILSFIHFKQVQMQLDHFMNSNHRNLRRSDFTAAIRVEHDIFA